MYKAAVRALMRHSVKRLNAGDYSLMLKMAHPEFELAFPGENSWATMFRPQVRGREPHVTHRGLEEATAFAERFVSQGIQFQVEDILVNGPPWNSRIVVRVHSFAPGPDGGPDLYANRAVLFLELRGGGSFDGRTTRTPSASPHGTNNSSADSSRPGPPERAAHQCDAGEHQRQPPQHQCPGRAARCRQTRHQHHPRVRAVVTGRVGRNGLIARGDVARG